MNTETKSEKSEHQILSGSGEIDNSMNDADTDAFDVAEPIPPAKP